MDTSARSALQGCVSSLASSMQLLDSSISILDSGVHDYPRLTKVLQTTRHFELVGEHDLLSAQSSLLSEIQPEVSTLLGRVETYLDKLERREQSLIAKAELQEGRLSRSSNIGVVAAGARKSSTGGGGAAAGGEGLALSQLEEAKMQQVLAKKERVKMAIATLELQATQKERMLRKSMAAQ